MTIDLPRKLAAEFIGMTLLVFVGCGTAVASQAIDAFGNVSGTSASFLVATALAFGFGIAVIMYTVAPISGGHINPAVTASLYLVGDIDSVTAGAYMATQMVAGVFGAALVWGSMADDFLKEIQNDSPPFLLFSNIVTPDLPMVSAFLIEALGTFLLVWTVCTTVVSKRSTAGNVAPIAVGWSVLLAHLVLIPYTGCGINPARSFGPHLVLIMAGEKVGYEGWWVYYTAPFVGGALAGLCHKYIFAFPEAIETSSNEVVETKNDAQEEVKEAPEQPLEVGSA